ncbi:MAG TPA: hypothetical protein ENJ31_09060 [Anaerolineae bacterium]|nr:hypothetical protein [Anaerolineae bacterium]
MQSKDTDTARSRPATDTTSDIKASRRVLESTTALRRVLLPVARFYSGLDVEPEVDAAKSPTLTANERAILVDAARKFAAEGDVLLRNWRMTGEFSLDKSTIQRDPKTGAWPEPSLSLVAELFASLEALQHGTLPASRQQQEARQMEVQLEMKRLELEQQRLDILQEQIRRGVRRPHDPGPVPLPGKTPGEANLARAKQAGQGTAMGMPHPRVAELATTLKSTHATPAAMVAHKMPSSYEHAPKQMLNLQTKGSEDSLQNCTRVALCDLLLCVLDFICRDGTLNLAAFNNDEESGDDLLSRLLECLGIFICTWINCYVNQLCPSQGPDCRQLAGRCDFAVEEVC